MSTDRIDEFAGMRRELEVGLRIAPTAASALPAAKAVASYLDTDARVPVRLVGLTREGSRILITLAVTLGTIDEIKTAQPRSRAAVSLLHRIVDQLAAYDPAFVTLPQTSSVEVHIAARAMSTSGLSMAQAVRRLVAIG